jgi:hypothetical protein
MTSITSLMNARPSYMATIMSLMIAFISLMIEPMQVHPCDHQPHDRAHAGT